MGYCFNKKKRGGYVGLNSDTIAAIPHIRYPHQSLINLLYKSNKHR